jgi:DNA-binding SARP family transcriptional activator/tetratricopeptide (TPR) repeat protein
VEFRILGPLEVLAAGQPLPLGGTKQRAVLAMLVVQAGRVVSRDRLINGLWQGRPPDRAEVTLRGYVSRLRAVLEPEQRRGATFQVLVSRAPGYVLRVEPDQVDAARFEALVGEGSAALEAGDPGRAAARLDVGLGLWRGPVLADFADAAFARGEIARLEQLRLVAIETKIEADLALGRHAALVGDLEALVGQYPLRERLRAQLMLALYRSGRQADALGVYQDVRVLLADELGIDPGGELQRLYEAILVQKSELDWTPPAPEAVPPALHQTSVPERPSRAVFVGRQVELAQLREALADARCGQGRLVLVGGEPGIGKTSIARQLAGQAQAAGMGVLWGRVWEADGAPAFWPWVQILRAWMQTCTTQRLGEILASDAAVIAQLVPEITERLPGLAAPLELEPAQARFRLFDAVTRVLKRVANAQPLVVVVDDLHRADMPSLRLLQFLARELGDAHLLVIGTFRDAKADLDEVVVGVLAELGRQPVTHRITLEGLGEQDVGCFVERATGRETPPWLVAKLHMRTGGNPLFLNQLVQPLAQVNDLTRFEEELDERVPQQVQEAVQWRLGQLPAHARMVLTVASVIGREFDLTVLQAASGFAMGLLVELVEQAAGFGVVAEMPGTVGRYRFAHMLVRDALYHQLGARRALLHKQAGEALERLYTGDLGPHLAELAFHFVQASDAAKALAYLTRAGQRALHLLAYEEAARLFALALDHHPDETRHCELLLALADAQMRAGDLPSTQDILLRAADSARALGDPKQLARAALGFGKASLGFTLLFAEVIERMVGLLEEALATLDAGDSPLRAQVLGHLAMALAIHYWQPDAERWRASRERQLDLSQQAVSMARRLGDTRVLASVLDTRCFVLFGPDTVQARLDLAAETLHLAEVAGDKQMAQQARRWRIVGFLELGNVPATDAELDRYVHVAEELRQPVSLFWAHLWKSTRALMAGCFDVAEHHNLQALSFGQRLEGLDATQLQAGVAAQLFLLRKEQGRLTELEETIKEFVHEFPQILSWRAGLALIHMTAGDKEAARWDFEQLAVNDFTRIPRDVTWLVTVAVAAEVCALLDDTRRATLLHELLLPFAQHCVVVGRGFGCLGSVAHYLGQLAVTMGNTEAGCQHFEVALEVNERIGATPYLAHTQYHYARALLTRNLPGDRETADVLQAQALETARALGMTPLIQQITSPLPTVHHQ